MAATDRASAAPAIALHGLTKRYGQHTVLDEIDLVVPGGIFALLGPNGAGKTTLIRILATLSNPDGGRATVAGFDVVHDAAEVRRRIALTGQFAAVDELQTGRENLVMIARLARLGPAESRRRADELLERFDLADAGGRQVRTWSGGMRRRLDLAASLVVRPSILFLDEPTTGLDPRSRLVVWEEVRGLADAGVTVILTTQYLEEADRLADWIAVLHGGRIVAQGTAAQLKTRVAGHRIELVLAGTEAVARAEGLFGPGTSVDAALRSVALASDGSADHVHAVLHDLLDRRVEIASLTVAAASLDDVFFALTGANSDARESTHA
jgi:ABC-2 type transport system ATP-binding protein